MSKRQAKLEALRVDDAARDACVEQLQDHFVVCRLTAPEFETRVEAALRGRTRGDLEALLADCEPSTILARRQAGTTWRVLATAAVAALALSGAAVAAMGSSSVSAELPICVASGVAVPEGQDCPVPTGQQEQLIEDAERAEAAAAQAAQAAEASDDRQVQGLLVAAQNAAQQAWSAVTEAELAVAKEPTGHGSRDQVRAAARRAEAAAKKAARTAVGIDALIEGQR